MNITESHLKLYKDFVLPNVCALLADVGVKHKTKYEWEIKNNLAELSSTEFDHDNYYVAAKKYLRSINKAIVIPAFKHSDVEQFFEDYHVQKTYDGKYKLTVDAKFGLNSYVSDHLPTMFGHVLYTLIQNQIFTAEHVSNIITNGR
jgi:hypothetical protein